MSAVQAGDTAMMSPAAVLDRILDDVLVTSDDWCQGAVAKDADGSPVPPDSVLAASFCTVGAIKRAAALEMRLHPRADYPLTYWTMVGETCEAIIGVLGDASPIGIPTWNDSPTTTFEDVRLIVKQAREAVS